MNRPYNILAITFAAALQAAAIPRVWVADMACPGAAQFSAYRGETVEFEARLVEGGRPFAVPAGATAKMLVSTNDFEGGCWQWPATVSTSGVVRATWLPEYDPGASQVRIFLAVSESGTNINYGANCTMRLLGSPGRTPGALPLPVETIDFAAVRALNAPWPNFGAVSNIVDDAIAGIDIPETSLAPATNYTDTVVARVAGASTNYTDAVAGSIAIALTNYTDVSIGSITNGEFIASNRVLRLETTWNGVRTNVWSSDEFASKEAVSSLLNVIAALTARVQTLEQNSGAGAQFWNRYAASGAANPDYENITVLNRAMTMFAAGFDIETSGAYGVFVQSGTVAFPSGGDGHFRLGVGTNDWFGIEVGGSVMVGAVAQSINVGDGVVFIDYPYSGTGDFPIIEMCTSLALMDWTTITPTWYDNGDGTATATCPATASSGFYRGWTSATMSTRFSTTLPIEAKGGIMCDDRIHVAYPVYNNGTVTWSAQ